MSANNPPMLPAPFQSALADLLDETPRKRRADVLRPVRLFCTWSLATHQSVQLDAARMKDFRAYILCRKSRADGNHCLRVLYNIGIAGPSLEFRDWLFENFADRRSAAQICGGDWWPQDIPGLLQSLEHPEHRRLARELDNFFRAKQRLKAAKIRSHEMLLLDEGIVDATRHRRISNLCLALELVSPRHPDLPQLRRFQRQLALVFKARPTKKKKSAHRYPDVERLLINQRKLKDGKPYSVHTVAGRRRALNLHLELLQAKGRKLGFDKSDLDLFAEHAFQKLEQRSRCGPPCGWSHQTAATRFEQLSAFINCGVLKPRWNELATHFKKLAANDMKMKERTLVEQPVILEDLFRDAVELSNTVAAESNPRSRRSRLVSIGAMGVLLFYPLRRSDVIRMNWEEDLNRVGNAWVIKLISTQKSGSEIGWIRLPDEANRFIDPMLLEGLPPMPLDVAIREKSGSPVFCSNGCNRRYTASAFTGLIRRNFRYPPHLLRTIWCDTLVERGADRLTISAMLQHTSIISQEDYEVLAAKIRLRQAMQALDAVVDQLQV